MQEKLDIKDEHGNVVIQPGLKVRHKASQYEYTVDDVVQDRNGEVTIMLNMPEEPRFDPAPEENVVISDARARHLYEVNPLPGEYFVADDVENNNTVAPGEEEFLAVPQKEFEKDYEVK